MLFLSICIMCISHILRMLRWQLFVKTYEKPNGRTLLQALSIGYFLNFFIPFKAGDLIRSWFSGKEMKNGKGFALATVIMDRYLDIIVVGVLFALFSALDLGNGESIRFYMLLAIILMAITLAIYVFRGYIKKLLKKVASLFNDKIEVNLLHFFGH